VLSDSKHALHVVRMGFTQGRPSDTRHSDRGASTQRSSATYVEQACVLWPSPRSGVR
jgi:hypothetical protein